MTLNDTIDRLIDIALTEDMPAGDVTTDALFTAQQSQAHAIAKADGVVSGLDVFARVFTRIDPSLHVVPFVKNGDFVQTGTTIARVEGANAVILKAERTALNMLQRMSGIATETRRYVDAVKHTSCKILDTRKTVPGLRELDKRAVREGGGTNHRQSLSDMAMLKDNHITAAGGISKAVEKVRSRVGETIKIEVEVDTIDGFKEALTTSADWIMLDNMDLATMRRCVELNTTGKVLEASGNMTLDRVASVAETGVDCLSVGALTHSVQAFDVSLKFIDKAGENHG